MTTKDHLTAGSRGGPDRAQAELLDISQVATLLNCSKRTVYRLSDAGQMPRPLKLGALVRWRTSDISQWITDGCPKCRGAKGGGR